MVLFFNGHARARAGTHLERVLAYRAQAQQPPLQTCDALTSKVAGEFETLLGRCLPHGRRKVVEVAEQFSEAARCVIETLAAVYQHDMAYRQTQLCAQQRLMFHQERSRPAMEKLHGWLNAQFDQRRVEPHSAPGKALRYPIRHQDALTLLLHQAGAPLDNNLCERVLKPAIPHRGDSMFYKAPKGSQVGDIHMSLIHVCASCGVNPFDCLMGSRRTHCTRSTGSPERSR